MPLSLPRNALLTGIGLILLAGCYAHSSSDTFQAPEAATRDHDELELKIDHPGKQGALFQGMAFSVVLKNVGSRPLMIRRPDLGINLRVLCKTETAMEWRDMIDAHDAVSLPEVDELPSRSPSPVVLLRPQDSLEEFVDLDCDQGDYQVQVRFFSEKESEINWIGACESNVLLLTVPPPKQIREDEQQDVY